MNLNKFRLAALVLFAAMITTNVNAQSIKYPKMHFGIRLGGTFNTATVDGEKITDVNRKIFKEDLKNASLVLQKGKKTFLRIMYREV